MTESTGKCLMIAAIVLGILSLVFVREGAPRSGAAILVDETEKSVPDESWRIYRGDSALRGIAAGELPDRLALAWTYTTEGAIISSPVAADGMVWVGSSDGLIHAVDLTTGEARWSYPTEDIVDAPPLYHDGSIYVGSSDGNLYALTADTGELIWKRETEDRILGGANLVVMPDGSARIVVGSYDTRLYCFDAKSGDELWNYATTNYLNGTPAILGDRIVFGGCDAILHVVSASTGELLDQVELGPDCHVAGSVALDGDLAYLGHYGNEFICVDLNTALTHWVYPSRRHAFFSSPAIGEDRIVFGGRDKKLHCVGKFDGIPFWTFPTRRKVDGSPVICGDKVVFGSGDGRLYLLSLEDGSELWSYEIGRPLMSSPAVAEGMVVVGCDDKRLYAFRAAGRE